MSGGVASALEEVLEGRGSGDALAQSGLFDLDEGETGALDTPSPLSAALSAKGSKAGRPKGARNRRTEAVVGWLLSQHRHPLSVMMEAYSMAPGELAERIGLRKHPVEVVTKVRRPDGSVEETTRTVEGEHWDNGVLLDIIKLQVRMAEAVAPYVAQKLPQAVTLDGAALLQVQFSGVSLPGVSSPARALRAGNSAALDGDALGVKLAVKSDEPAAF